MGRSIPVSVFLMTTFACGTDSPLGSVTLPPIVPLPPWPNAAAENPLSSNRIASPTTPYRAQVLDEFLMSSTPPCGLPGQAVHPHSSSRPTGSQAYASPTHYRVPIHTFCSSDLKME